MSTDIGRYIEVYTDDVAGYTSRLDHIDKLGNFKIDDIILCYENSKYYQITGVDVIGDFVYTEIKQPTSIEEALDWHPEIAYYVEKLEQLPNSNNDIHDGDIYYGWRNGKAYYKAKEIDSNSRIIEWISIKSEDVPRSWKTVAWHDNKGNRKISLWSGCSVFFDMYGYDRYYDKQPSNFAGRGKPENLTEEVAKELEDSYSVTWCTLSELHKYADEALEYTKRELDEAIVNENKFDINKKLDSLIANITRPLYDRIPYENSNDDYDGYTFKEAYDEYIWAAICGQLEIEKIENLLQIADMSTIWDNVRIIYNIC